MQLPAMHRRRRLRNAAFSQRDGFLTQLRYGSGFFFTRNRYKSKSRALREDDEHTSWLISKIRYTWIYTGLRYRGVEGNGAGVFIANLLEELVHMVSVCKPFISFIFDVIAALSKRHPST